MADPSIAHQLKEDEASLAVSGTRPIAEREPGESTPADTVSKRSKTPRSEPPAAASPKEFKRQDDPAILRGRDDVWRTHAFLDSTGRRAEFRALERPQLGATLLQLTEGVVLVTASVIAVGTLGWVAIPLALVVIARNQRLFGNILHDASHGNIVNRRKHKWTSRLIEWFVASMILNEFESYRRTHSAHHAYLGDPERDPDYVDVAALPAFARKSAVGLYASLFFSPRRWVAHLLGEFWRCSLRSKAAMLLCWGIVVGGIGLATDWTWASRFAALWLGAMGTTYFMLKTFTEISDHVGLEPGSIYGFSRNAPNNALSWLIHPHNDSYHLTHHLAPRVPLASLDRAHKMLLEFDEYAEGHQCDGYFFGRNSVAGGWVPEDSGSDRAS